MTLDEAIEHATEQADVLGVCDCASEHMQLVMWLKELKQLRSEACPACGGTGRMVYGSTATYMGGIGGAAMTEDWCEACWGTGIKDRKGPDLKQMRRDAGTRMTEYRRRMVKAERKLEKLEAKVV